MNEPTALQGKCWSDMLVYLSHSLGYLAPGIRLANKYSPALARRKLAVNTKVEIVGKFDIGARERVKKIFVEKVIKVNHSERRNE
jgi:hypothetical protein